MNYKSFHRPSKQTKTYIIYKIEAFHNYNNIIF